MVVSTTFSPLTLILIYVIFTIAHAQNFGFSVDLIHRDSLNSPLYKPSESHAQRISNAFRRSINRVKRFAPTASFSTQASQLNITLTQVPQSDISPDDGEYVMNITIGTPPVNIVAIADTGSDLIWTQCKPCIECYKQKASLFDPSKSSTYEVISCQSKVCNFDDSTLCEGKTCKYKVYYGDSSYTKGNIAEDTVSFPSTSGKSVIFPKTIFGCGYENGGNFGHEASGIIGLGRGKVSLINQLGPIGGGLFSYCLVPLSSKENSKINFGASAIVHGEGAVSTPIIKKSRDNFYYLTLEGLSVGDERFKWIRKDTPKSDEGNVVIDSGTTVTILPPDFYNKVESAVKKRIKQKPTRDPDGLFHLCYKGQVDNFEAPILTAHFTGADVKLKPINTFVKASKGLVCFAIIPMWPTDDIGGYIGNTAQINFLIGYNLKKNTLTFKNVDCARKS